MSPRCKIGDVAAHHVVVCGKKLRVASALVDVPGRKNRRAAPLRRVVEYTPLWIEKNILRRNLRNAARGRTRGGLRIADVACRGRIEAGKVEVVELGGSQQVRFLEPAKLFAMGAVGKQTLCIVFNGTQNQRVNAVEQRVGSNEAAHLRRAAMHGFACQADERSLGGLDLHVSESPVTEARMPAFHALAAQRIGKPLGAACAALRDSAVGIQ